MLIQSESLKSSRSFAVVQELKVPVWPLDTGCTFFVASVTILYMSLGSTPTSFSSFISVLYLSRALVNRTSTDWPALSPSVLTSC